MTALQSVNAKVVGQLNELSYKAMFTTTFEYTPLQILFHPKVKFTIK